VTGLSADYFDQWYADIDASQTRRQVFRDALQLPAEIDPSNLVPLAGLEEIAEQLAIPAGGLLVDLACGRGGPGMWLARATGARLVGVDFSPVAVAQAAARRLLFDLEDRATFVVGDLTSTELAAGTAHAVVCVDAFLFAADVGAAGHEVRRLLRPGGRVVMTGWEAIDRDDESLSERTRRADFRGHLLDAGLVDVVVEERPNWYAAERRLWELALALDAPDDPAVASMQEEAASALESFDRRRRVMASGRAPI
jgi:SAM-dependent methyltransferase